MLLIFFSFLFFPLSSHSFMLSSSSFQSIVLECCKNHLPSHILHLWGDPKSSYCCYQNYLMQFYNAYSFSFCKCCDSHLSGLCLSVERSPVYFSFKILTLWNFYRVRLFRAKAGHMMSNTLGSHYLSPKILEVLVQCINCLHVFSFSLVRCTQRTFQGCLCSGWT